MKTVSDLYKSAAATGYSKLKRQQANVKNMEAEITEDSLRFIIPVKSFTVPGKEYTVNILFKPITFITEEEYERLKRGNATRIKIDGTWYYYIRPTLYTTVQVSCTCENYGYTWAYPNAREGSHYGPLPQLAPSKGIRPPRNPEKVVGMCKHICTAFNSIWGWANTDLP